MFKSYNGLKSIANALRDSKNTPLNKVAFMQQYVLARPNAGPRDALKAFELIEELTSYPGDSI